jgi:hypothetical protein
MAGVNIILEGDDALKDWRDSLVAGSGIYVQDGDPGTEIRAVYLRNGTSGGMPAAVLAARDAQGRVAIIEVTARMFNSIAAAFRGRADFEGTPLG